MSVKFEWYDGWLSEGSGWSWMDAMAYGILVLVRGRERK
jgi:hypothetical protein